MSKSILISYLLFFSNFSFCQSPKDLILDFQSYKESQIINKYSTNKDVIKLLEKYKKNSTFEIKQLGESVQKRPIFQVKLGHGKTKVLLWSQMHGDEPTATMSIFDIFNLIAQKDSKYKKYIAHILDNLTLYFIPMLNPDGAELIHRRNAQDIDINRDALNLETPEARILRKAGEQIEPDFGFNLHDQNKYYGFEKNANTSTIALLAPRPTDDDFSLPNHEDAKRLIVHLNNILQEYIPNKVGKFKDEYEPNAFGEFFQSMGTTTILVEGGYIRGDEQKQEVRKYHTMLLFEALTAIASMDFKDENPESYYDIPINKGHLHDLIIRNCRLPNGVIGDIAFRKSEIKDTISGKVYIKGHIRKMGNCDNSHGFLEYNAKQAALVEGKLYKKPFRNLKSISKTKIKSLIKQGYTDIIVLEKLSDYQRYNHDISVHPKGTLSSDIGGNFVLKRNEKVLFGIVNACIIETKKL